MADGSAPKPYTEEDVKLVAEAICDAQNNPEHHPWTDFDWKCEGCVSELDSPCSRCAKITRTVLDALAEAGRLRPVPFDLGNPLGWSPEQIRAAEERSNELDKLIDRGSDG